MMHNYNANNLFTSAYNTASLFNSVVTDKGLNQSLSSPPSLFEYHASSSSASTSSSNILTHHETNCFSHQEPGFGERILIGAGRSMVNLGQGITQLGLNIGEALGFNNSKDVAEYTAQVNNETHMYHQTDVGQSTTAQIAEVATDMLLFSTIPGGAGARGTKLVVSSAATGAVISGLQATEDGSFESRLQNAAIGGIAGGVGGYALDKVIKIGEAAAPSLVKLFDNNRGNHVSTPHSRVTQTSLNVSNLSSQNSRVTGQSQATAPSHNINSAMQNSLSSPNSRVTGPSQVAGPSPSHNTNTTTQNAFSHKTQQLIDKHDRFKSQLFEREGAPKSATSLEAARIELTGEQISLAIERGVTMDHVTKVRGAQNWLVELIEKLNNRLSHPELPTIERSALQQELSNTSKLLDYSEQFVPRPADPAQLGPLKGPNP